MFIPGGSDESKQKEGRGACPSGGGGGRRSGEGRSLAWSRKTARGWARCDPRARPSNASPWRSPQLRAVEGERGARVRPRTRTRKRGRRETETGVCGARRAPSPLLLRRRGASPLRPQCSFLRGGRDDCVCVSRGVSSATSFLIARLYRLPLVALSPPPGRRTRWRRTTKTFPQLSPRSSTSTLPLYYYQSDRPQQPIAATSAAEAAADSDKTRRATRAPQTCSSVPLHPPS